MYVFGLNSVHICFGDVLKSEKDSQSINHLFKLLGFLLGFGVQSELALYKHTGGPWCVLIQWVCVSQRLHTNIHECVWLLQTITGFWTHTDSICVLYKCLQDSWLKSCHHLLTIISFQNHDFYSGSTKADVYQNVMLLFSSQWSRWFPAAGQLTENMLRSLANIQARFSQSYEQTLF